MWKLAAPRAEQDYAELLAPAAARSMPTATEVADWQKVWLENLVKKERYEVDASEVRQYFPYERVLAGLLEITSRDLRHHVRAGRRRRARGTPSVLSLRRDARRATKLGRIYLDMHPREGKYKHAAQFPLKDGVRGVQLPEGVLVCNFPDPRPATRR